jgi:hypothetical protein
MSLSGLGLRTQDGVKFWTRRRQPRRSADMSHLGSGWPAGHDMLSIALLVWQCVAARCEHGVDIMGFGAVESIEFQCRGRGCREVDIYT